MIPPRPPRNEKKRFRVRRKPDAEPLLFVSRPSGVPFRSEFGNAEGGSKRKTCREPKGEKVGIPFLFPSNVCPFLASPIIPFNDGF